jgi:hypothetical protein
MSEATPAGEAAETTSEPGTALAWDIHTVESWARAIIDDMAQEVASSGAGGIQSSAVWRGIRFPDGSFGAALKIEGAGAGTYSEHRVKLG